MRDLRSPYPVLRALCPAVRISPCRYLPVCRRRSCWGVRPVRPLRGPTNRNRAVGVGILEQVIRFDDAGYGCEVMLSGGVALFDQPAGVVEYFLHEVLVHAAAEPAGEVVTRHRPVAVRHLEITAVVVDRQRGPVLEQVLVGGVTEREGSGELRFERQFFGSIS